uniref:Uncharacterized protein n=1 Tax=Mandrillus leucophaeus TaxID=9568 RepID=A0A2K5XQX4_MANLE
MHYKKCVYMYVFMCFCLPSKYIGTYIQHINLYTYLSLAPILRFIQACWAGLRNKINFLLQENVFLACCFLHIFTVYSCDCFMYTIRIHFKEGYGMRNYWLLMYIENSSLNTIYLTRKPRSNYKLFVRRIVYTLVLA